MKVQIRPPKKDFDRQVATEVGQTLRRLRKCAHLSQEQLGKLLELHQAAICRVEGGQQDLEPWHFARVAEIFGIRAADLLSGNPNYWAVSQKFGYRLPFERRHLDLPHSKSREVLPIFKFMAATRGLPHTRAALEKLAIKAELIRSPDQPIGVNCALDLLRANIANGTLNNGSLRKLAAEFRSEDVQGFLHDVYSSQESAAGVLGCYVLNHHHYERNFKYELTPKTAGAFTLAVTPSEHMKYIEYKDEVLGDVLCRYKRETLSQLPRYIGKAAADVSESECHFHGAKSCVYTIRMTTN